jgi:thiol-disulfide isomerase/thioredoxin
MLGWGIATANEQLMPLAEGGEMPYQVFPGDSEVVFLLMPMEFGPLERMAPLAKALGDAGQETWLFDPFANHFLTTSTQSMDKIPAADIAALIQYAHQQTGKQVMLLTTGRGAIPALRGVRAWQQQVPEGDYYRGTIMLHPKLFVETPAPGEAAHYMPITYASSLPLYIFSPTKSPSRWRILEAVPVLETGGSPVYVHFLDEVRNFFFVHPEAGKEEKAVTRQLPRLLTQASGLLLSHTPSQQVAELPAPVEKTAKKELRGLEPYQGDPQAAPLSFSDTEGKHHNLADYRGQVVLLNFWATWCPPCVHEMPSMQRLADSLAGQPFAILAVNMAEKPNTVKQFLKRDVSVRFPVLLDSEGLALKDWPVYVYPTTYIVDKQGRIRYAMYGAIEWDNAEVKSILGQLLQE